MFVSATLLFMVQPMVGKMILPTLGGSPAAWNTCMVFFQGLLLIGYLYAHKLTEWNLGRPGRQVRVHIGLLIATVAWLVGMALVSPDGRPVAVFESIAPQGQAYPMIGVLALLGVAVGLPFLVVSTSAPLLQRWFVYTGHSSARDPYFLYAASNAGSLLTLIGYPLIVEPTLTVKTQTWVWAGGFALLTGLVYLCGRAATDPLGDATKIGEQAVAARRTATRTPAPPLATKLRWVALAFVPSSLMLGVTFHMTTDIASVPLLWVIPLALYLLTFIIAFARTPAWFRPVLSNVAPVMILLLVFVMSSGIGGVSTFMKLALHLAVYFATALLLHTELARLRPAPDHLTGYFLLISVGGVLGGIFNALIAPVAFPLAWEYPIALAVACLLVPSLSTPMSAQAEADYSGETRSVWRTYYDAIPPWMFDVIVPLAMLALAGWLAVLPTRSEWFMSAMIWTAETLTTGLQNCGVDALVRPSTVSILVIYAVPCMLCFLFIDRPIRFGLCVAAVLFAANYRAFVTDPAIDRDRSFFGILKVNEEEEPSVMGTRIPLVQNLPYRSLYHGTTLHGKQAVGRSIPEPLTDLSGRGFMARRSHQEWLAEAVLRDDLRLFGAATAWDAVLLAGVKTGWDFRQEPLTYYHRTGPVGEIFAEARHRHPLGDIGMIGLGTGSVAAYARPGQSLTFYEIDPTVLDIVETPRVMNPDEVAGGSRPTWGRSRSSPTPGRVGRKSTSFSATPG